MKTYLKIVIGVQLGVIVGGLAVWAGTYISSGNLSDDHSPEVCEQLALLARYSNILIPAKNFNCEGVAFTGSRATVGDVMASMMNSNLTSTRNQQSFECIENVCTLSISDCKPWQSSECSTRFLKYELDQQQKIKPNSFNCIDVP